MVSSGHQVLWDGPPRRMPWWWAQVAYHEKRIAGIAELSALDDDHEPPGRDLWYSGAYQELKVWIDQRQAKHDQ